MAMDMNQSANGHPAAALDQAADEATQMAEQARQALEAAQEQVAGFIRERPLVCLAGALALGYVIGKIVSR